MARMVLGVFQQSATSLEAVVSIRRATKGRSPIDASRNLWLFGGSQSGGLVNDLWKYGNGEWTWMAGPSKPFVAGVCGTNGAPAAGNTPEARQAAVSWTDSSGNFWLFGGNGLDAVGNEGVLSDLWKYSNGQWAWISGSNLINQNGNDGTRGGMLAPGNVLGGRLLMGGWEDANGNFWLFGGYGYPAIGTEGDLNDLWMYMP